MIAFRFHLVSIVAIFLALGLGVLTGTTVLNRGIVAGLENQTDRLAAQRSELREALDELSAEADVWRRFGEGVSGLLVEGRLEGTEVVLITQEGTDEVAIDSVRRALDAAGATMIRRISIDGKMALTDRSDRVLLSGIVGGGSADSEDELLVSAADRLADQLAFGTVETDLVEALREAGFLREERSDPETPPGEVDPDRPVIVAVAGGDGTPPLEPASFLVPLVERLVLDGQRVAASESESSDYPFVALLRDGDVGDRLVTQDNVDQVPGEVGLVLGIEGLLVEGATGHYGIKDGADGLLPSL